MPFLPFIPFVDCAEVVIHGISSATAAFLTLGFKKNTAIVPADLPVLGADIEAWYHTNIQPNICPSCDFTGAKVTDLTTAVGAVDDFAFTPPTIGGATPPEAANNVCMVVSFGTALRGRSFRGRNYVPALPNGSLATGTLWTAGVAAIWTAAYNALPAAVSAHGWTHVILSRHNNGVRRTVGVATAVNSYEAKQPVGTQRRRVIGHGI